MKQLLFLFVLAFPFLSSAQDYSGFYSGCSYFFSFNTMMPMTMVREDTNYFQGSESVKVFELTRRSVSNEMILDTNCTFWGDPACQVKIDGPSLLGYRMMAGNGRVKYFNFSGDSLTIRFDVNPGDTQTVFRDTNNRVVYSCISKDTATLFGQMDSLILFFASHLDSNGVQVTNGVDGDSVLYSKNCGLILGFAFDYFPEYSNSIRLRGIRDPNIGFFGLTPADIYDYQPGDQFETNEYSPPVFKRDFYEVLSRTDTPQDVQYDMLVYKGDASWQTPPFVYDYDTVVITYTYSKMLFMDEMNFNITGYSRWRVLDFCYEDYAYSYPIWSWPCEVYCPTSDCYGSVDCFGGTHTTHSFVAGLGKYYEGTYQYGYGYVADKDIVYANLQGLECGSSYILSNNEINFNPHISIYPNPANNFVSITSDEEIHNSKIVLSDISGREINQYSFSNSLQIDLSGYSNGIYFIQLYSGSRLINNHKLIRE